MVHAFGYNGLDAIECTIFQDLWGIRLLQEADAILNEDFEILKLVPIN
jgi:hypothetical protein